MKRYFACLLAFVLLVVNVILSPSVEVKAESAYSLEVDGVNGFTLNGTYYVNEYAATLEELGYTGYWIWEAPSTFSDTYFYHIIWYNPTDYRIYLETTETYNDENVCTFRYHTAYVREEAYADTNQPYIYSYLQCTDYGAKINSQYYTESSGGGHTINRQDIYKYDEEYYQYTCSSSDYMTEWKNRCRHATHPVYMLTADGGYRAFYSANSRPDSGSEEEEEDLSWIETLGNYIVEGFSKIFVPSEDYLSEKYEYIRNKFSFIWDIISIIESMFTEVSIEAVDDTPPVVEIDLSASTSKYNYGGKAYVLDMSWYQPYKPAVDIFLRAILWGFFLWRLFVALPNIINGVAGSVDSVRGVSEYIGKRR